MVRHMAYISTSLDSKRPEKLTMYYEDLDAPPSLPLYLFGDKVLVCSVVLKKRLIS